MPPPLTTDQVQRRVKEVDDGKYELVGTYLSAAKPITLLHTLCGGTTEVRAKGFLQEGAGRCRTCYPITAKRGPIMTQDVFLQRVALQLDSGYKLGTFDGYKKPITVTHEPCGTTWETTPHMLVGTKQRRCPTCANSSRGSHLRSSTYLDDVLASQEWGTEYEWLEAHQGDNKQKLAIRHKSCEREYAVRPNDFQQGYRCPHCASDGTDSYGVKLIIEELEALGIEYLRETTHPGLYYYRPLRFDFELPLDDGFKLIIEYDGQQHFKASGYITPSVLRKTQARDAFKNRFCENPQLKLKLHRINYLQDVRAELRRILDLYFVLPEIL